MNEQRQFVFDVAFNESEVAQGQPLGETLQHMKELVEDIAVGFRSWLD